MKEVPLTRGYTALVDDEDFERVDALKWHAIISTKSKPTRRVYAVRNSTMVNGGPRRRIYMHGFVFGSTGMVDHKDCNGLNNQKCNLRSATGSQNNGNQRKNPNRASSPFKGVRKSSLNRWQATIQKDGTFYHLGLFKDEVDAATAYNFKAFELFGEFARFNTPLEAL